MSDANEINRHIWRRRGWRFATGLNVCASLLLAVVLVGLVNYFTHRLGPMRVNFSQDGFYGLSDKTKNLLSHLEQDVHVISFFSPNHKFYDVIRRLLKEYEYASAESSRGKFKVDIVDPNRDLALTRRLKEKYKLATANVVVFDANGRCKYVEPKNIFDIDEKRLLKQMQKKKEGKGKVVPYKAVSFLGEQAFSSAIQSVTQSKRPVVYFLSGHGEGEITDFEPHSGYSTLARMMRRDNMVAKPLMLAELKSIPQDCSALVIAGPTRKLSQAEVGVISKYLHKNGRLCVLLNPAVTTGLESLLASWGVHLEMDVVLDPAATRTGRELLLRRYGKHEIVDKLKNLFVTFYSPRSVEPVPGHNAAGEVQADKSKVFVLATTTEQGWAERNLKRSPADFNAEVDRPGPVSVAVAVEKGPVTGIEVEIKPTRMVVIGDADFVSDPGLQQAGGGNLDFFMSSVNWLVEREELMAVAPRAPALISLELTDKQSRRAFAVVTFSMPLLVAMLGLVVWWRRKS